VTRLPCRVAKSKRRQLAPLDSGWASLPGGTEAEDEASGDCRSGYCGEAPRAARSRPRVALDQGSSDKVCVAVLHEFCTGCPLQADVATLDRSRPEPRDPESREVRDLAVVSTIKGDEDVGFDFDNFRRNPIPCPPSHVVSLHMLTNHPK